MGTYQLFGYFRSSAAYRVRLALNLKGIKADMVPVALLKNEQTSVAFKERNPQGLVPALGTDQGTLAQSLAIIEWLEATHPQIPLLPGDPWQQAQIRAFALAVACDVHPLGNLRVTKYLAAELGMTEEQKMAWYDHWMSSGFEALEVQALKQQSKGPFCFGPSATMADICLIPQIYNALRFKVNMDRFPRLMSINQHCQTLDAFKKALPENQADAF